MDKEPLWWGNYLFAVVMFLGFLILSAAATLVIMLVIDAFLYPGPPGLSPHEQSRRLKQLGDRIGRETFLVIYIPMIFISGIYCYFKYCRKTND